MKDGQVVRNDIDRIDPLGNNPARQVRTSAVWAAILRVGAAIRYNGSEFQVRRSIWPSG